MARGTTLSSLITQLRVQLRQASNPAVGGDYLDNMKEVLRVAQRELWDKYDWPHLRARRDKTVNAGQRYYDFPSDMPLEAIDTVHIKWGNEWVPVEQGIGPEQYAAFDSDNDERADPIQRWDVLNTGTEQFEIWPLPATDSTIRFEGKKALGTLTAESDTADLDDRLIVLQAAITLETDDGAAQRHAALLSDRLVQVRAGAASKRRYTMSGESQPRRRYGSTVIVAS